ncbi:MAG TPA: peptide deformylase [Succinivibrionaceae bacterium]|nr:peptide deformylase [Succinivibrio sp.]HAR80196.1 peptide deformylase [Succinivibrionaceae bacterium]
MKYQVVIFPDERLRRPNTDVTEFNNELKEICENMFETMYADEGIGLAAPQVGINKRLVVIDIPDDNGNQGDNRIVLVNPRITKLEGEIVDSEEGCLSVPGYQAAVKRYEKCSVDAKDVDGKDIHFDADGLFAICLQHETDHLDGKLFIDQLSRLKRDRLKKKYSKILKEREQANES